MTLASWPSQMAAKSDRQTNEGRPPMSLQL